MADEKHPMSPFATSVGNAAESAQQAYDKNRNLGGNDNDAGWVTVPGGQIANLQQYLDHTYYAEDHSSIFADPAKYMKEVKPDCMYVWASIKDPKTFGKKRSGLYRAVLAEEIRDDTELPIETHTIAGEQYVGCWDVVLFEVPADAVKRLYKWREAQAVLRTAHNLPFEKLKKRIEQESGGAATAEVSIKVD